jgi:hypothetical protein
MGLPLITTNRCATVDAQVHCEAPLEKRQCLFRPKPGAANAPEVGFEENSSDLLQARFWPRFVDCWEAIL